MDDKFQNQLIADLATNALREQRARRRWGIFFKSLTFAYIIVLTYLVFNTDGVAPAISGGVGEEHAAVISIEGTIEANSGNDAKTINAQLQRAFNDASVMGIILDINSPGGSAVESHRIYKEIRRLREKHPDKKLYAVAGDYCASGGYFIAAAADEIYADESSLIGSIGVIFSSFGFVDAIDKLGVQRRVITAGKSKNLFDPFLPENASENSILLRILDDIHAVFIRAVKNGRGERLAADHPGLFEGRIFSGVESIDVGLIDGFGDVGTIAREQINVETVVYYQDDGFWLDQLTEGFGIPSSFWGKIYALPAH